MTQLATYAGNRLRLMWIVFIIYGLTSIISTESAGWPTVNYQLTNGALLPHVNRLRANRHRRDVNPSTTDYADYVNVTATTAATNRSTVGVTDVTSSSRDVTSRPTSHRPTTGYVRPSETTSGSSPQTSTQNTSNVNVKTDKNARYYTHRFIHDKAEAMSYWVDIDEHSTVFYSHYRKATTVKLKFKFFFYGHEVNNITITTGGFVYMSEFLHAQLAFSQYIAPLMADFMTVDDNNSSVRVFDNGTAFVVSWHNTVIKGQATEPFVFQLILYNTSEIVFVYKSIPVPVSNISTENHKVVVGLSDAYYYDEHIDKGYMTRTISEYSRISINTESIMSGSAVVITPLPTCIVQKSCKDCLLTTFKVRFECQWCSAVNRCSDGYDRHRQQWLKKGCLSKQINLETKCPASGVGRSRQDGSGMVGLLVILIVIALILLTAFVAWIVYAIRNPNSSAGQCLIQNRPSQLLRRCCCCRTRDNQEQVQRYVTFQVDDCAY